MVSLLHLWPLGVTLAFDALCLVLPQLRARGYYHTKGALNVWSGKTPYDANWRMMWVWFAVWHVAVLIHTFLPAVDAALSLTCCPPVGLEAVTAKASPLEEAASTLLHAATGHKV